MGGKTSTSTQSVSIPKEVMARYNSVNARAEQVAKQPFQRYSNDPSAFVAPMNNAQNAGIYNIGRAQGTSQPFYAGATALTLAGADEITPDQFNGQAVQRYMSPYLGNVVGTTMAAQAQQNAQQRNDLTGNAIRSGAFGGDRAGVAKANLAYQQNLSNSQTLAGLLNQGYGNAQQMFQQQQGVNLAAQQANQARLMQAGQQLASLGTGLQQGQLQAGQALLGAGTAAQQTEQAGKTALYNQFLQERGYPFQVAQFLANIAMGTGALSGSTTTTTQPSSFFSDERLKEGIEPVGETYDGQPIYRYNYKGDPRTQIGLIAQDVEDHHPEAVGLAGGFRTVDYRRATDEAADRGRFYAGGLVPANDRSHYAPGGLVDPNDMQAILASQQQAFGPFAQSGLYGGSAQQTPHGAGYVPQAKLPTPKLMTAGRAPQQQPSAMQEALKAAEQVKGLGTTANDLYEGGKKVKNWLSKPAEGAAPQSNVPTPPPRPANLNQPAGGVAPTPQPNDAGLGAGSANVASVEPPEGLGSMPDFAARGGLIAARHPYAGGGDVLPYDTPGQDYFPDKVLEEGDPKNQQLPKPGQAPGQQRGIGNDIKDAVGLASSIGTLISMLPFSDARLKHNIEPVGETFDGQKIYRYDMGDGRTQMGLMAQEVLRHNPHAVGEREGYLTLDYDRATEHAAHRGHFYHGGLVPRHGYATDGAVEEDPVESVWPRPIRQESGGRQFDRDGNPLTSSAGAIGVAQVMPKTAPEAARLAGVDFDEQRYRTDPEYNEKLGKAYFREQYRTFQDPMLAAAAYNAGPGAVQKALQRAQEAGGDYRTHLPAETQGYLASIFGGGSDADRPSRGATAVQGRGVAGPAESVMGFTPPRNLNGEQQGWGDFLTSRQFVIPFLTGLGAMASSPSRYLGSAMLQGLGAGAKSYMDLDKNQQEINESKAREISTLSGISNGQPVGEIKSDTRKPDFKLKTDYGSGSLAGSGVAGGSSGSSTPGGVAGPGGRRGSRSSCIAARLQGRSIHLRGLSDAGRGPVFRAIRHEPEPDLRDNRIAAQSC